MRLIVGILFIAISFLGQAKGRAGLLLQDTYLVIADSAAADVPDGMCLVKGHVYKGSERIDSALIATLDRRYEAKTDSTGAYSFMVSSVDTSIFCFKSKNGEVVVWNYNFQSGHEVTINFYLKQNLGIEMVAKPVIYAYSDLSINTTISVKPESDFTFTYPEYENGWNVEVSKNGIKMGDKTYPYLFWESEDRIEVKAKKGTISGFCFSINTASSFFEEKLSLLGLNDKERTDFITFWVPKLQGNNYGFVQFLVDEEYDQIATFNSTAPVDNMRRVYAIFSTSNEPFTEPVSNPELNSFERNGFTIVEWGGSLIENPEL